MAHPSTITEQTVRFLLSGDGARRCHGAAQLHVDHARGDYVLSGWSGLHVLAIEQTPVERLDAPWQAFASHPLNQQQGL